MKTRQLAKALIALGLTLATSGVLGSPASANDADLTTGTFELYTSGSDLLYQRDWGDPDTQCSTSSKTFTLGTPTHAWAFSSTDHFSRIFAGTSFTVERTFTSGGTSSSGGTMTGTATLTVELYPNNGTCARTTAPPCVVTAVGIALTGTHTMATGISASDTATLSGDNGPHGDFGFETDATGSCGVLTTVQDGSVSFTNLVIHVTT